MRRRFLWRAGLALFIAVLLVSLVIAVLVDLLTSILGGAPSLATVALVLLLVLALIGTSVRRVFRGAARPVADLVEAAGRVEGGDYAVRVPVRGPREVRSLAGAFNAMSARLEETEAQRQRLLADVSHELRTPLTVIQGSLEGILDGLYPPDEAHLAPILEETRVMSRLIDDLRTLASAEAGSLSLHREATDVSALLADAAAAFGAHADAAGVELAVVAAPGLPPVDVDPERVRQVVANLVANALRHTPRGGRIEMRSEHRGDELMITVTDTGSGMAPDVLDRIFDRFYRSPDSAGSGLGLPIARGLVHAHGGEITAESTPGVGTTVRFSLPVMT
jgi:signal transduction histidine kinase